MSIKLKDFARTDIESDPIRRSDESEDEDISYLPTPSSGSTARRRSDSGRRESSNRRDSSSPPRAEHAPKLKEEKPFIGPPGADGTIRVKYAAEIDGYGVDSKALAQMESLGLPTGFSFSQATPAMGPVPEKQKKGDKKTFYCQICLIELNSLDTMKSHVSGVKHMKKKLQLEQQREEQRRNGELAEEAPTVIPIPNPENTKKKVPVRLHERIKETRDPVVGLDFVQEFIAVSDPEMEPHYECELCGNKGIANGMFSHIMGFKHRQEFVRKIHENTPDAERMMDLSQRELLEIARKYSENKDDLNAKIRCRRSDEEYPWPSGKAPWSVERGGTGIPPDRARENWGRNRDFSDHKPVIVSHVDRKPAETNGGQPRSGLPAPGEVRVPRTQAEAARMLELSQRLMQVSCQFLGPSLSDEEKTLLTALSNSVMSKILTKRQITPLPSPSQNGHHSPSRPRSSFSSKSKSPSSSASRRRPRNSRSPSPSPRPGPSNGHGSHHQNGPPIKKERTEYRDRTQKSSSSYHDDRRGEDHRDDRRRGGDHHHEDRRREDDLRGGDQNGRGSSSHREDWGGGRDYFERREPSSGRYPPSSNGRRY